MRPGMKPSMQMDRGPSITVIEAIIQQRGMVNYKVFERSNNSRTFEAFLQQLKAKCMGTKIAVLDNQFEIF